MVDSTKGRFTGVGRKPSPAHALCKLIHHIGLKYVPSIERTCDAGLRIRVRMLGMTAA